MSRFRLDSFAYLWLAIVLAAVLANAYLMSIEPHDYWWYVRIGAEIAESGRVPAVDTLSYTRPGTPFVYHSWLSATLLWAINGLGGTSATVLTRGLLVALYFFGVWLACRELGAGPRLATAATFAAGLVSAANWGVRPQTFALPLFALALVVLLRWQRGEHRWLFLLPLAMALWVNLHGSFVMGLLLVGAALIGGGGNRRVLAITLGGMVLATLLNPRGFGAWSYVLSLLTDSGSQTYSVEWRPPSTERADGKLLFGWLLLLFPLVATSRARLNLTQWLWLLGFGWMALSGIRYVIWFLAILGPITAQLLAPFTAGWGSSPASPRPLNRLIVALLLLAPTLLLPGVREAWWPDAPPTLSENTPVDATTWLAARPELEGPLWSDIAYSSYLTWALPSRPVWSDTRFELYPIEQWDRYVVISEAAPGWDEGLDEEGINLLMLHPRSEARLLLALETSDDWCRRYESAEGAVILSRRQESRCPPVELATIPNPRGNDE